jgi:hypothetical protein
MIPGGGQYVKQLASAGTSEKRGEIQAQITNSLSDEKNRSEFSISMKRIGIEQSRFGGIVNRGNNKSGMFTATTAAEEIEFANTMKAGVGNIQAEVLTNLSSSKKEDKDGRIIDKTDKEMKADRDIVARIASGTMLTTDIATMLDNGKNTLSAKDMQAQDPNAARAIFNIFEKQLKEAAIDPKVIAEYKSNMAALKSSQINELNLRRQYNQRLNQCGI